MRPNAFWRSRGVSLLRRSSAALRPRSRAAYESFRFGRFAGLIIVLAILPSRKAFITAKRPGQPPGKGQAAHFPRRQLTPFDRILAFISAQARDWNSHAPGKASKGGLWIRPRRVGSAEFGRAGGRRAGSSAWVASWPGAGRSRLTIDSTTAVEMRWPEQVRRA